MSLRKLITLSAVTYLASGCSIALADPTVDLATNIMKHEYSELKTKGDTGIRIEIEQCYKRLGFKPNIRNIRYCYLLDYISNEIDESVRQQLGIAEDPSGFHGNDNSLKRVVPSLLLIDMSKQEMIAIIAQWNTAAIVANNR